MKSSRILIDGIETNYIAYDNGTVFDERLRAFVQPIYRKSKWPFIKVWFQKEERELVLKDVIADAFIPDPYERSIVGYLSPDISNNSVFNLIRMEDPSLAREKRRAEKAAKRAILDAKRAERERLRQELEARREARIQRQREIECKRFEKQSNWVKECEERRKEFDNHYNNKELINEMKWMRDREYIRQTLYTEFEYHVIVDPEDAWKVSEREASAHEVCGLLAMGYKVMEIVRATGVPISYINNILYYGAWGHIAAQYGIQSMIIDESSWNNPDMKEKIKALIQENPNMKARDIALTLKIPATRNFYLYTNSKKEYYKKKLLRKQKREEREA